MLRGGSKKGKGGNGREKGSRPSDEIGWDFNDPRFGEVQKIEKETSNPPADVVAEKPVAEKLKVAEKAPAPELSPQERLDEEMRKYKKDLFELYLQVPLGIKNYRDYPEEIRGNIDALLKELRERGGVSNKELGEIRVRAEEERLRLEEAQREKESKKTKPPREVIRAFSEEEMDELTQTHPYLKGLTEEIFVAQKELLQDKTNSVARERVGELKEKIFKFLKQRVSEAQAQRLAGQLIQRSHDKAFKELYPEKETE